LFAEVARTGFFPRAPVARAMLAAGVPRLRIALAAALFLLPAAAAQPGPATLRVEARDDGPPGSHTERPPWFQLEGDAARDPTLVLPAGSDVQLLVTNRGRLEHDLHVQFAGLDARTPLLPPNGTATLALHVPANATGLAVYWCDAHRVAGMVGTLAFDARDAHAVAPGAVAHYAVPFPPVAAPLAALAAALFARRRA
jgi:hypothetical protein